MNIRFYKTFSKRRNSTKQVGTATYSTHTCTLKQPTSMHDPVVQLATSEMLYTYAYIPDWSSYYFVQDVVSLHNGLVEFHLVEDVLATFKSSIGGTTARVLYSSSIWDPYRPDPRMYVSNDMTMWSAQSAAKVFNGGSYVLTVYNNSLDHASTGFAMSYELTQAGMYKIRQWFGANDIITALKNYFNGNPLESVFSCIWVPYTIPAAAKTQTSKLWIGDMNNEDYPPYFPFDNNTDCYYIHGMPVWTNPTTIQITNGELDFRDFEPYSMAQIYLPGVGVMDLSLKDLGILTSANPLAIDSVIEIVTGNVMYKVKNAGGNTVLTAQTNVAAQCPLGQMTTNGGGALTALLSTGAAVAGLAAAPATGGASAVAGVGLAMSAANIAMSSMKHSPSIAGSCGGALASIDPYIRLNMLHSKTEDVDSLNYIAQRGRPYGETVTISTLSGYVQCEGASVSGSMTEHEREEINEYLNSGFYYE